MRVANPPGKQKSLVNHGSCYPQPPSPNPAPVVKARVFAHEGTATAPGSRCLERDLQTASAWLTVALSSWNRRLSFAVTIGIRFRRRFARRFRERFSGGSTTKRSPWSPKLITIWTTTERHAGHDEVHRLVWPSLPLQLFLRRSDLTPNVSALGVAVAGEVAVLAAA
jgi:hypothetical protein